jgi:hypothetical protein
VKLFRAFVFVRLSRARDDTDVARNDLAGSGTGQQVKKTRKIGYLGNYLIDS